MIYSQNSASINAITVAASDTNDATAWFSNYGDPVDIWAPGVNVTSTRRLTPSTELPWLLLTLPVSPHTYLLTPAKITTEKALNREFFRSMLCV